MVELNIRTDSVIYIAGKRKSGKSFFLKKISYMFPKVIIFDNACCQHSELGFVVRSLQELKEALHQNMNRIVIQFDDEREELFDLACKEIWFKGGYFCFFEEIDDYVSTMSASEWFSKLVRKGRNRGIGMGVTNQVIKTMWTKYFRLTEIWIIFKLDYQADLDFLREYNIPVEQIPLLQQYGFIMKNDKGECCVCQPI